MAGDYTTDAPLPKDKRKRKPPKSESKSPVEPPAAEPPNKHDNDSFDEVAFTAFHPEKGTVDSWYTLLVYAHLVSALNNIYQDAGRFQDQIPEPHKITSGSLTRIARGTSSDAASSASRAAP